MVRPSNLNSDTSAMGVLPMFSTAIFIFTKKHYVENTSTCHMYLIILKISTGHYGSMNPTALERKREERRNIPVKVLDSRCHSVRLSRPRHKRLGNFILSRLISTLKFLASYVIQGNLNIFDFPLKKSEITH